MNLTVQFETMLAMIAAGLYVGAALDTYTRFVKRRRRFHLMTIVSDLFFWLVQSIIIFYVLFLVNNGQFRIYIIFALLCGYAAYQSLFRSSYIRLLNFVLACSAHVLRFVRFIFALLVIRPIKMILKLTFTLCMMIITSFVTASLFLLNIFWKLIRFMFAPLSRKLKLDDVFHKMVRSRFGQAVLKMGRKLADWRGKGNGK